MYVNDERKIALRARRLATGLSICLLAALGGSGCATRAPATDAATAPIEIEAVRLTAAGHYVDLRYRVNDPERAQAELKGVKPLLIDEKSGIAMAVPTTAKLGSLRQTSGTQKTGRSYFVLFINAAGLESGDVVTAEMGDLRFEKLIVQ